MNRFSHKDRATMKTARVARSLVAGVFVAGIAALIATQPGRPEAASDRSDDDFLHAPARTPLKPSVEPVLVDLPPAFGEQVIAP